jgi:predicted negative regulator of RcsB-dependent stress response
MTTPGIPARQRYGSDEDSIGDWALLHRRELTWGLIAVAVLLGGFWFYNRSQSIKAQRAESAYFQARQAAAAGNLQLAVSDLRKVVARYEGTRSGTQAALMLAQTHFDQKQFKEGLEVLKKVESSAADDFMPSIYVLEAAGHEELKDYTAAAEQYKLAAAATEFPVDKAKYQAAAARDYMAAGKPNDAKAIWTELAKDEAFPEAAEARVRLGELTAKPMKI